MTVITLWRRHDTGAYVIMAFKGIRPGGRSWQSCTKWLGLPTSHIGGAGFDSSLCFQLQPPVNVHLRKQKVLGSCPFYGRSDLSPWLLASGWPLACCGYLQGVNQQMQDLFVSMCLYLPLCCSDGMKINITLWKNTKPNSKRDCTTYSCSQSLVGFLAYSLCSLYFYV